MDYLAGLWSAFRMQQHFLLMYADIKVTIKLFYIPILLYSYYSILFFIPIL